MSMSAAKEAIIKMFLCFPSARTMDREQAMMMAAAYLETVQNFSSQTVCAACDAMRRRSQPFPPSAGELYDECASVAAREKKDAEWEKTRSFVAMPRLSSPVKHSYSHAELADFSLVINSVDKPYVMREISGTPLTIPSGYPGEGRAVFYGYLTPKEAKQPVKR